MSNKYIKNNGNGNFKVTVPFEINTYNQWSVVTEIITPETFEDCTLINTIAFDNSEIKSFKLDITSTGALTLYICTDGTTYTSSTSTRLLEPNNQVYYIKVFYDGTKYVVETSTNNVNWIQFIVIENSTELYANSVYVNFIPTIDSKYYNNKLNLSSTKLLKKASGDSNLVEIFSGDTASPLGYINHGVTIDNDNIASGFSTSNYIVCNGVEQTDYIKIITRISITNYIADVNNPIISTSDRRGIFVNAGRLGFALTPDGREILVEYGPTSTLDINTYYYIGYIFHSNNGVYEHALYYMKDDGYYNDYTELPDFNAQSVKPWIQAGSINNRTNVFTNSIYLGSNKTQYANCKIDLNNTAIGNDIVTYSVSKPGLTEIKDPDVRCYIPEVGTRVLNSSEETVEDIELESMVKLTIIAQDYYDGLPIDLSNATVTYTVTNSNYGSSGTSYYKTTTQSLQGNQRVIYVIPGSTVIYSVSNLFGYPQLTKAILVNTEDVTDTIILQPTVRYTFTVNAINSGLYPDTTSTEFYLNDTYKTTITGLSSSYQYSPGRKCSCIVKSPGYTEYTYNAIINNDLSINAELGLSTLTFTSVDQNPAGILFLVNTVGSSTAINPNIKYSTNGGETWTNWEQNVTVTLNPGQSICVKGYNPNGLGLGGSWTYFNMFGKIAALGNINSLLDDGDGSTITAIPQLGFRDLFSGCSTLVNAPELPAQNLSTMSYSNLFKNCTSLTKTPEFKATNLGQACYYGMFNGCTSLTQVSDLSVTTIVKQCYERMFSGCTALVRAPEMFFTNVPQGCCYEMFKNCSSLNYIKMHYTGYFSINEFYNWVDGVAASGDFYYNGSNPVRGINGVPTDWTLHTF